ncbi:MAG: hypothetical protein R3D33_14620 [Hyphomicrobiaceae bacterium]
MGVTIHYELVVASSDAAFAVLEAARAFAAEQEWDVESVDIEDGEKTYMFDEVEEPYRGPLWGVVLRPHQDCESLAIVFGANGVAQDYCKTQFAPVEVHVSAINLLKQLAKHCESLSVRDEGEYLSSGDREHLAQRLTEHADAIQEICAQEHCQLKYRSSSGRIWDGYGEQGVVEVKL